MNGGALLVTQVEHLLDEPIRQLGLRLIDVEYKFEGGWVLRLYIDSESGITLDNCAEASQLAAQMLDEQDTIPSDYHLEVSSPGLFRPLRSPKHFRQCLGQPVKIRLAEGHLPERKSRRMKGTIATVRETGVTFDIDGEQLDLPFEAIGSAKLDPKL